MQQLSRMILGAGLPGAVVRCRRKLQSSRSSSNDPNPRRSTAPQLIQAHLSPTTMLPTPRNPHSVERQSAETLLILSRLGMKEQAGRGLPPRLA